MDCSQRFLEALECPDDAKSPGSGGAWPIGIPNKPEVRSEHSIDFQFLSDDSIAEYLNSVRKPAEPQKERAPTFDVDFAHLSRNWATEAYPLGLCEFLAYQAGLAYRDPLKIKKHLLGIDHSGQRYYEGISQLAFFDSSRPGALVHYADTQAFAFTHGGTGYLIFRGSSSFTDWWSTNFLSELTTSAYPSLESKPQTLVGSPKPARHTGFAIAWGSIAPEIELWVRDQIEAGRIDKIILSGHSLGGALAVLGAHHFASSGVCKVHAVVTFGAPKVGGDDFKSAYEDPRLGLKERTLRIESAEDVVTLFSIRQDDRHVGHPWNFKKRPMRPAWQMLFFAPMVAAEEATKRKVDRLQARQRKGSSESKTQQASAPTNRRAERERTWEEFYWQIAFRLLWYLARSVVHAVAAHSVEKRYGLYLSTLSYQRIRHFHHLRSIVRCLQSGNQENKRLAEESALMAANNDLRYHLWTARGRYPKTFRYLSDLPIRIDEPRKLSEYATKYRHYIV